MTLCRWGFREWGGSLAIATALSIALWHHGHATWIWLVAFAWLAIAAFFRHPVRTVPADADGGDLTLLSPADGTISAIERMPHASLGLDESGAPREALVVRVYLSVLNVHTNRAPCAATVTAITHTPGRYLDVRIPESAKVNERVDITLLRPDGLTLGIRQIAGAVARRIICHLQPGDCVARGGTWGLIKFGSTTELVLPADTTCEVIVKVGDTVEGGVTPLIRVPAQR